MAEPAKRRYLSKLIGNVGSGVATLLSQMAISRTLGPTAFGQFAFIQSQFEALFGTLDFGCSSCYFTQISQDKRHYPSASGFYFLVSSIIAFGILAYVTISMALGASSVLWPGVPPGVVWVGVPLGFSLVFSRNAVLVSDAAGLAQKVETLRVARGLITLLAILLLAAWKRLDLTLAILLTTIPNLVFCFLCFRYGHKGMGRQRIDFSSTSLKRAGSRYYAYCKPLIVYSLFAMVAMTADRWILQIVNGSTEQAYIGVATLIGTAIFLITNALTNIFHRECAVAFANSQTERLRSLIQIYVPRIFALAAFPSLFVAMNAKDILIVYSGPAFAEGWKTLAVFAFYPIVRATAQLGHAAQFATNYTRLWMQVGIVRDIFSTVLVYFLVAPRHWAIPGLGLGALGVATNTLIAGMITAYTIYVSNSRRFNFDIWAEIRKELLILASFGLSAFLGWQAGFHVGDHLGAIGRVTISLMVYGVSVLLFSMAYPSLLSVNRVSPMDWIRILPSGRKKGTPEAERVT